MMCILSGWEDPIIFRRIIVDLRGVEDVKKKSCECYFVAYSFVQCVILSGGEDPNYLPQS